MFFKSIQILIFSFSTILVFGMGTDQCASRPFKDIFIGAATDTMTVQINLNKIPTALKYIRDFASTEISDTEFTESKKHLQTLKNVLIINSFENINQDLQIGTTGTMVDADVVKYLKDLQDALKNVDSSQEEGEKICKVNVDALVVTTDKDKVKNIINGYKMSFENFKLNFQFKIDSNNNMATIKFDPDFYLPSSNFNSTKMILSYIQKVEMSVNQIKMMNKFNDLSKESTVLTDFQKNINILKSAVMQGNTIFDVANDKDSKMMFCSKIIRAYDIVLKELKQVVYGMKNVDVMTKTRFVESLEKSDDTEKKNELNTYLGNIKGNMDNLPSLIQDVYSYMQMSLSVGDTFAIIFGIITFFLGLLVIKLWYQTKN